MENKKNSLFTSRTNEWNRTAEPAKNEAEPVTPPQPEATELHIEAAIPYSGPCDALFFGQIVGYVARFWKCQKKKIQPHEMEAIRRAAALLQGIVTGKVIIKKD